MHAINAGVVTGRRNNPAPPAANDDRLIANVWIVAFLDGAEKSVTIDVSYAEAPKLWVRDEAC